MKTQKLFHALVLTAVGLAQAAPDGKRQISNPLPILSNLTAVGASLIAGDAACPNQHYFLYSGGKPDNFAAPNDPTYPSQSLSAYLNTLSGPFADYDQALIGGKFGDSFNLQNQRGVCYAVLMFRAQVGVGSSLPLNELVVGHVDPTLNQFTQVAKVSAGIWPIGTQSYAFTLAGRNSLGTLTGWGLNAAPADSILDILFRDSGKIDFLRLYVWYGPNCSASINGCPQ